MYLHTIKVTEMDIFKRKLKIAIEKIQPLKNNCWKEIENIIVLHKLNQKEYYSRQGEALKHLGFLCSGTLRAYYIDDKGNEWTEHFFIKNDFVTSGTSPMIKNITNVQALSESYILAIPFSKLIEISDNHPEINIFIQKLSFKCLENRQKREFLLQSKDALNIYHYFKHTFPGLEEEINHYHIASYIGVSPTQFSRIKKKIKLQLHM